MAGKNYRKTHRKKQGHLSDRSQAYFYIHAHALFSSLGRLVRNPFTTTMTVFVMAIAISLAAGFYLFVTNVQQLTGAIESTNTISVFLKPSINDETGRALANDFIKNSKIEQVNFISKQQALNEFKKHSGFGDVLNFLDTNPLPVVIEVLPANSLEGLYSIELLRGELAQTRHVDFVQMDTQWVKRLQSIVKIMQRAVFLLTIFLGCAVLLITGNTIRLELQSRRDEVVVAKLVGATHSFIQRPFLYTGFWLGFLSGLLAWILVMIMAIILQGPIDDLSTHYQGVINIHYLGVMDTFILLLITSILGIIGAWMVLHSQVQQIKPE